MITSFTQTHIKILWYLFSDFFILIFKGLWSGSTDTLKHLFPSLTYEVFLWIKNKNIILCFHSHHYLCQIFWFLIWNMKTRQFVLFSALICVFWRCCLFQIFFSMTTGRLQLFLFGLTHILWLTVKNKDSSD